MKKIYLMLIMFLLIGNFAFSGGRRDFSAKSPSGSGGKFLGNILDGIDPESIKFSQYWNQVTPGASGKWGSVEETRGVFNWTELDKVYSYAKSHNMVFKEHTLVWGSAQPSWIGSLSQSEQRKEVEEWFAAVADRYPDLDLIDVVNEPFYQQPPYKDALGGDGSTGWDWVITSFEMARRYFPKSKLLINEYGIVNDPSKAIGYAELVNLLKARGLIDGVGVQCHAYDIDDVSASALKQVLNILDCTGLPLYFSELDLDGDDQVQLQRYQEKFPVIWEHPSVKGVTAWDYVEGKMYVPEAFLLRSDGTERPALTWLMKYVREHPENSSTPSSSLDKGCDAVQTLLEQEAAKAKKEQIQIIKVPENAKVVIDGSLDEWPDESRVAYLNRPDQVCRVRTTWNWSPEDLSATIYLMWDNDYLYYAAVVDDDVYS